jgi:hypothetical protein
MNTLRGQPCSQIAQVVLGSLTLAILIAVIPAQASSSNEQPDNPVKELTLEQLGNVEVTTVSKEPEQVWKTAASHAGRRYIDDFLRECHCRSNQRR